MAELSSDAFFEALRDPIRRDVLLARIAAGTEAQRGAMAPPVVEAIRAMRYDARFPEMTLVLLWTVSGARRLVDALELLPHAFPMEQEDAAVQVLAARRPAWLPDLATALLRRSSPYSENRFRIVRALVRSGLVDRPTSPDYAELMVEGLAGGRRTRPDTTVLAALRADPGLLDTELWLMLSLQSAGRLLGRWDKSYPSLRERPGEDTRWSSAVLTLSADGAISRNRLLDTTLGTMLADWAPVDVAWHVGLHEALAPDVSELRARQSTYARLLTVPTGPVAKVGLAALTTLLAEGSLDADALLAAAPAPLLRPDKGLALATLRLLLAAARAYPAAADRVAGAVALGLEHSHVQVQEKALALLARLVTDPARRAQLIEANSAGLAPSLRPPAHPVDEPPEAPAPVLESVRPTRSPEEVLELLGRLLVDADDSIDLDRALDGMVRWPWTGDPKQAVDGLFSGQRHWLFVDDLARAAWVWARDAKPAIAASSGRVPCEVSLGPWRFPGQPAPGPPRPLGAGSSAWAVLVWRLHEVAEARAAGDRLGRVS